MTFKNKFMYIYPIAKLPTKGVTLFIYISEWGGGFTVCPLVARKRMSRFSFLNMIVLKLKIKQEKLRARGTFK